MTDLKAGTVLVAHPDMFDPTFARSVIVLLAHDDAGGMGVNLAGLTDKMGAPFDGCVVQLGGPVYESAVVLHAADQSVDGSEPVAETGFSVIGVYKNPDESVQPAELMRLPGSIVFLGYAGWGGGQLEMEIEMGGWKVSAVKLDAILAVPVGERWEVATKGVDFGSSEEAPVQN